MQDHRGSAGTPRLRVRHPGRGYKDVVGPHQQARCPWVVACGCWAHVLDLLLKDIGKLPWFKSMFKQLSKLRMFLRNKQSVLARLRFFSPKLAITNPGATRFRSSWIGAANICRLEGPIRQTMVDPTVSAYVQRNKHQKTIAREGEEDVDKESLFVRFKGLQTQVLDDDWWEHAKLVVRILSPIARLQAMTDSNAAMGSKMYYNMYLVHQAVEEMEGMPADVKEEVLRLITKRWDYGLSVINLAGNVLDPEYWSCVASEECMNGFVEMVDITYPLPSPLPASATAEQMEAYKTLNLKAERSRSRAVAQLSTYKGRSSGLFNRPACADHAATLSMFDFWTIYGACVPELQTVALRVAGQPASSSASERALKSVATTLTLTRNRMGWDKALDIVYVKENTRMLNTFADLDFRIKVIPDAGGWDEDDIVTDLTIDEGGEGMPAGGAAVAGGAGGGGGGAANGGDEGDDLPALGAGYGDVVDEAEDDMEPELSSDDEEESPNPAAKHLRRVADRLERLEDAAVLRIEPRDEPLTADADETEARRGRRACRAPARFRE